MRNSFCTHGTQTYRPLSHAGDPIAVSSNARLKTPSNGRSSRGFDTSDDIRTIKLLQSARRHRFHVPKECILPRFPQLHLHMSILVAKRDLQRTQLVSAAAIQSHILAQSIENKVALGNRERCFLVHDERRQTSPGDFSERFLKVEENCDAASSAGDCCSRVLSANGRAV